MLLGSEVLGSLHMSVISLVMFFCKKTDEYKFRLHQFAYQSSVQFTFICTSV